MNGHKSGCMLCGAPLVYSKTPRALACAVCGGIFQTDAACAQGHFVCDACHAASAADVIARVCLHADERNPARLALRIMRHPSVHMHGPEHHALTGCVLLAAYRNSGGAADLESGIPEIIRRAGCVPGGSCGFMGCCGAAVGAGTYWSVARGATPLSREAWADCNRLTALCLEEIAAHGGPRCCKRDTFLSLRAAVAFTERAAGVRMDWDPALKCEFSAENRECLTDACPFFSPREQPPYAD